MLEINAKQCIINHSGNVVLESIGNIDTVKINTSKIIGIKNFNYINYPNTMVYICHGGIGFITNGNI